MTYTDGMGRRVEIRTAPSQAGTRLLLTIYPRKPWAGRPPIASAHLTLELSPGEARELAAALGRYLDTPPPVAPAVERPGSSAAAPEEGRDTR